MKGCAHVTATKLLIAVLLLLSASMPLAAQGQAVSKQQSASKGQPSQPEQPSPQNQVFDENFVIASLLISEPGGALYSRLGHAALRMQCPEHNLDYVFTYEAEDASAKVLRFFAGKLKMGMIAIPPELYFDACREFDRGVRQYTLNLPIEAKRHLWKVLDDHLLKGINLPYDYLHRGCANSVLHSLKDGLKPLQIEYGPWPEEYELTRREIGHYALSSSKWARVFLHLVCGGEIDRKCSNEEKVITPEQLLQVLSTASVNGAPIISSKPEIIVEGTPMQTGKGPSPVLVAVIILIATIICCIFKSSIMDYILLSVQTFLGLITIYLVFFSNLVCTEWNWLIIPFNPLPLIFWKWRRNWALPYAIVLLVWCAFMFFWPHKLTDGSFIIITLSIVLSYIDCFIKYSRSETYEEIAY